MNELVKREPGTIAISEQARRYVRNSKAESTLRAYKAAWREFEHFAAERGEMTLPADPTTVVEYITTLADKGAKVNTIQVKLSAIRWAHRIAGKISPTVLGVVKTTMSGIRRELGVAPTKKEPATLSEVKAMVETLPDTIKGKRDKALLLVGFAGAFRRSELVAVDVADVRLNGNVQITARRSKTDQEGKGQVKTIPKIADRAICPVRALKDWLDAADIKSGAVFRRVDRHGNV